MFQIRRVQRAVFQAERSRLFEQRMYAHLRSGCSPPIEQGIGDEALRSLIRDGINDAAASGIRREYDVRRFLEHVATHGRSFQDAAPVAVILQDHRLSGTRKMDLIDELEPFSEAPCRCD